MNSYDILRDMNMTSSAGDSIIRCEQNGILDTQCLHDRDVILKMQSEAPNVAVKYTAVIISCYVIGLVILWLHFVKQKYGQVNLTIKMPERIHIS